LDLEDKISKCTNSRIIIAIEGVYSMGGDIAPKEFSNIANKYNAILIVDEAHSSGVIGENLLGWYDYHNIKILPNHIKMGTLGKAYGSYGAYILASKHIISYLVNRGKPIIYSTAPSLFDTALGLVSLEYIVKNKELLKTKIKACQMIVKKELNIEIKSLILPIVINNNKKVIAIQDRLKSNGYIIGAIREPTVKQAILRIIMRLDISHKDMKKFFSNVMALSNLVDCA
jgi:8-amino-7-oxononanoate synthase